MFRPISGRRAGGSVGTAGALRVEVAELPLHSAPMKSIASIPKRSPPPASPPDALDDVLLVDESAMFFSMQEMRLFVSMVFGCAPLVTVVKPDFVRKKPSHCAIANHHRSTPDVRREWIWK